MAKLSFIKIYKLKANANGSHLAAEVCSMAHTILLSKVQPMRLPHVVSFGYGNIFFPNFYRVLEFWFQLASPSISF